MSALTIMPIPDDALANFTVPAGTVVYLRNQNYQLVQNWQVNIEERGATNYDNQRRATDPETGQHLFWVKGPFSIPALAALPGTDEPVGSEQA